MKQLVVEPIGWPCTLRECPAGLFTCGGVLGFKSVHPGFKCIDETPGHTTWKLDEGSIDVYLADGGGHFWGDSETKAEREMIEVQPCEYRWVEYIE